MFKCQKCKKELTGSEAYEYRGVFSCEEHFDEVCASRDFERQEIIQEENRKTECFKGLDLGDTHIGKANREILKGRIEIAKKESGRIKSYENRCRADGNYCDCGWSWSPDDLDYPSPCPEGKKK